MLDVALLGTSGMMPLPNRFLTSLMLRLNGRFMLIDCGEGTQISMKLLGWGFKNVDVICFTHVHADHIAGLPGLLLSIGNSGRIEDLTIIGPAKIKNVVKNLCVIAPEIPFHIDFIELKDKTENISVSCYSINALPVSHNIPCFGYSINVLRGGKFIPEKAEELKIPKKYWSMLQRYEDVLIDGKLYTSDMVLGGDRKGIKVSYITDTRPIDTIIDFIKGSDLFIAEGIYGEDDKLNKAIEYKHMLVSEACGLAKRANVKELWLTHFSPSMTDPEEYSDFANKIFPNTVMGYDRINKTISFE